MLLHKFPVNIQFLNYSSAGLFSQRLPSVILLLNDILKHTEKKNEDHVSLDEAINSLKGTMNSINECKRKTEGHVAMFDVINDIDNVPPYLLSSHRQFLAKVSNAHFL